MLFREVGNGFYKCTTCDKQYKKGNGYTNLLNHLRRNHDNYEQEAEEASLSEDTLSKYIGLIFELLELRVARELSAAFGLVIDDWTSSNRHYIAVFAVFDSDSTGIAGGGVGTDYFDDLECSSPRFLLLDFSPLERVKALVKNLIKFEGVTQALQKSTLTMSAMRRLFDQVVKEYPALKARLDATAQIVNNPHLEQGLVKLQRGEALTIAERSACAGFKSTALERAPAQDDGNSSIVKAAFKKKKAPKRSHYVDVAYVPPNIQRVRALLFSGEAGALGRTQEPLPSQA
ncbi:unnamed protein product [Phytophthora fragariaefolia]|uniref:Unnamed protein product n=1 Tax=Phytophthora fragariaefolia TaxID=1490495 RepID=A0A9W7CUB6_9STRA|nr:unnamed protein product [Phytophthora fragariaefolia]